MNRIIAEKQHNEAIAINSCYCEHYILRKRLRIYLHRYFPTAYSDTQSNVDVHNHRDSHNSHDSHSDSCSSPRADQNIHPGSHHEPEFKR